MLVYVIGLAVAALSAWAIVYALQKLGEDSTYFPDTPTYFRYKNKED